MSIEFGWWNRDPEQGKYQVNVTFADPGQYTIRCMASDGALNTYKDVVVQVK